mmetsp:Transcript_17891/g.58499  ORF Transcript_17891/g.58499 Transcript_17891/m.58499 type:complete len:283 (+) Transcript_17891:279-1127(+)|eukprot:scaffold2584_cov113-Isochrysis_galbana.AAC.6
MHRGIGRQPHERRVGSPRSQHHTRSPAERAELVVDPELIGEAERHCRTGRALAAQLLGPPHSRAHRRPQVWRVGHRHSPPQVLRQHGHGVLVAREEERVGRAGPPQLGKRGAHLLDRPFKRRAAPSTEQHVPSEERAGRAADQKAGGAYRVPRRGDGGDGEAAYAQGVAVAQRVGAGADAVQVPTVHGHRRKQLGQPAVTSGVVPVLVRGQNGSRKQRAAPVVRARDVRQRTQYRGGVGGIHQRAREGLHVAAAGNACVTAAAAPTLSSVGPWRPGASPAAA